MSDWQLDEDEIPYNKSTPVNDSGWTIDESDHMPGNEAANESLGQSSLYAVPRILKDAAIGTGKFIGELPKYFDSAKTELGAFLNPNSQFREHPLHLAGQTLAGLNEAINSIAQLPLNAAEYGSNRLHLLPPEIVNAIKKISPEDTSNSINQLFGQPQYSGEALIRGIGRNILPIAGLSKIVQDMPHLTQRGASGALRTARELGQDRNIDPLNIDPALIEDTRQFLPNTTPQRNAINAAHTGDYNNLFNLQSDLGKNASDYAKSMFSAAERAHGRAGLDTRNRLLDAIHENLQSQGHQDISELLRKGQNDYRRYIGFKPYRNILGTAIGAGLGSMLFPQNPISTLLSNILSQRIQQ